MTIAAPAPVLHHDPAQLVRALVRSVERVLGRLSTTLRDVLVTEFVTWREWADGLAPAVALRESVARVRHALFRDAALRHGSLDLAASCVAIAVQSADTASRVTEAEDPTRRHELLWSARLGTERVVGAAALVAGR